MMRCVFGFIAVKSIDDELLFVDEEGLLLDAINDETSFCDGLVFLSNNALLLVLEDMSFNTLFLVLNTSEITVGCFTMILLFAGRLALLK